MYRIPGRAPFPRTFSLLGNIAANQAGWFAAVWGGAHDRFWPGVAAVLVLAAVHLVLSPAPAREAGLLLAAAVVGTLWDSLVVRLGLAVYPSGVLWPGTAPVWIGALWLLFGTSLNVSFAWLHGRPLLAGVFGALGGPIAWAGGWRLGGVMFPEPALALLTQAAGWAVLLPLLTWIAARTAGSAHRGPRPA